MADEEFADGGGVVGERLGPCWVAGEVERGESGESGVGVGAAAEIAGFGEEIGRGWETVSGGELESGERVGRGDEVEECGAVVRGERG